ncbi:unnamed protein product, partial [Effrenium voratum]
GSSDSDPSVPLVLGVNSDRGPMKWMKVQALISVLLLGVAAKPKKQIPEPQTPAPEQPTADHVKFQDLVAGPLKTASDLVDDQVDTFLQRVADVVSNGDEGNKEMLTMATDIRKLLAKVVPMLLSARDNSSALDVDTRPSNRSQATYAQDNLLKLQTYTGWAWPVIIDYTKDAYDDKELSDDIKARMMRGTDGSLSYLSSVLVYAWTAAKFQFPVVEEIMQTKESNGEILMKAGCAASYAKLLGDITQMYADLSDSKQECFMKDGNFTDWQKCAYDSADSLYKVNLAIAESSNAMWQCFGIYWGCSQLINQAYADLSKALAASMKMTDSCNGGDAELCRSYAFQVLGVLSQGGGLMESATDDCSLKGASGDSPLNPWAATPFEKREDASETSTKV